jgi:hypothetical protein
MHLGVEYRVAGLTGFTNLILANPIIYPLPNMKAKTYKIGSILNLLYK